MSPVGLKRLMEWSVRLRLTWSSWPSHLASPPPPLQSISTWSRWRMSTTQCASVNEASLLLLINLTLCIGKGENGLLQLFEKLLFIDAWKGKFGVNRENVCRETVYETPHSLLDNISLGYRQVFLAHPFISPSLHSTWEVFVHLSHFQFLLEKAVTIFRLLEPTSLPSWKSWKRGEKVKQSSVEPAADEKKTLLFCIIGLLSLLLLFCHILTSISKQQRELGSNILLFVKKD